MAPYASQNVIPRVVLATIVLDGGCFGQYGEGYIRFSYANSQENLKEAVARIQKVSTRWQAAVAAR